MLSLDWDRIGRVTPAGVLAAHDLFGKPVSTFPDHALSKSQEAWPGAEQGWESLREPRSKRRKAGAPLKSAQPPRTQMSGANRVHLFARRHMVGMRLSALRLPFIAGGESIFRAWS